jgi:hypothetical protein
MPVIADALKVIPPATMTAGGVFQTTAGGNLILNAPGSNRLSGKTFFVQASGYVSCASGTYTQTIQPILYGDASLATVTTKPLFSCTAGTIAFTGTVAAAIPWSMFGQFEGDSVSAIFYGNVEGQAGATYKVPTVSVAPVSSINFATEPPVKFAVGITAGAGTLGASPKFVITEFVLVQE